MNANKLKQDFVRAYAGRASDAADQIPGKLVHETRGGSK